MLLAFLACTSNELAILVECCEHPVFKQYWMDHTRLRITPDSARSDKLLRSLSDSTRKAPRPVHFAVADSYQLSQLLVIRDSVQALTMDRFAYAEWPERSFEPAALRWFPNLVRLDIHNIGRSPVDLNALSSNAPKLQSLTITGASRLQNDLRECTELRVLWLENTNIEAFAIAVGLSKLSALTLKTGNWIRLRIWVIYDIECLENVVPLSRLAMKGDCWRPPQSSSWLAKHLPSLRSYAITDGWRMMDQSILALRGAVRLRDLRLGLWELTDLEWLEELRLLEKLQVVVSSAATHCRPLRCLGNLRKLWIKQGWLCDIVGYLPKLTKLVCEDTEDVGGRARFERRSCDDDVVGCGGVFKLRELSVRGRLTIDHRDVAIREMLNSLIQIELFEVRDVTTNNALLEVVAYLPRLERVAILHCSLNGSVIASAPSLIEVFLSNTSFPVQIFPSWLLQAAQLRVLVCNFFVNLTDTRAMPLLSHLYLSAGQLKLHRMDNLRVLGLPRQVNCEPFRRERGPGCLLPSLQSILHPTADCLWFDPCSLVHRRRRDARDAVYGHYTYRQEEPNKQVFEPSWSHDWNELW